MNKKLSILTYQNRFFFSQKWQQIIPKKYHPYIKLGRYDKQIGTLLVFIPFTWGQVIAMQDLQLILMSQNIGLFYLSSVTLRSAACAINDFWDVNFDKQVERTKERPLANKSITYPKAFLFCISNTFLGLSCLYQFGIDTLMVSMMISPLVICYPLAKRFTFYPQFVLGATINYGIVIAYYATQHSIDLFCILPLYTASVCWTVIYDTIYAFQDIRDDLKIGVKSTAIKFDDKTKQILSNLNLVQSLGLIGTGIVLDYNLYIYLPLIIGSSAYLQKKLMNLNLENIKECTNFFKFNKYYGFFIFLCLLGGNYYKEKKQNLSIN